MEVFEAVNAAPVLLSEFKAKVLELSPQLPGNQESESNTEMIMTKFFQFLTILNLAGLIVFGFLWFSSRGPSKSAVPTPTASSQVTPTITPMSTPPTTSPTPMTMNQQGEIKGEPGKLQTVDVSCGHGFDRSVYGDYDGNRVYFHSAANKSQFESDVAVNLQKIHEKGIVLEKTPK